MLWLCLAAPQAAGAAPASASATADVAGAVTDSATAQPLQGAEVEVLRDHELVAHAATDPFGRFVIHEVAAGEYVVRAHLVGFRLATKTLAIDGKGDVTANFVLASEPIGLAQVSVQAHAAVAVDRRTGNQVFQQNDFHGSPTITASQIIQQSIAGAVRAPTGEVHIRGQHAEYTYYIDGVPVPSGISGSLNELFDPSIVNRIEFQTGGWDAEYGNKNAAIVDVTTRVPAGGLKADLSAYGGSFAANGQSAIVSSNTGKWGWVLSGTRQASDMRQEPVLFDTLTNDPVNFHNHGEDLFGFGKLQFLANDRDLVHLDTDWSRTRFAAPYDSTGGVTLDDHQEDLNSFVNLAWQRRIGEGATGGQGHGADLFSSLFVRHGRLTFTPGATDDPSFVFFPDPTAYNLAENRNFNTYGAKVDYTARASHAVQLKGGVLASVTRGHETFLTTAGDGSHGPASDSDLNGHDVGVYAQTVLLPSEHFEVRTGARFDSHTAPFAGTQRQLSPRVKVSVFPTAQTTVYAYYGRQFLPTNIEDLRSITSAADSGVATAPTLPERDDFYELGAVHHFAGGITLKLDGYLKTSLPGIDDNTVPGSAIVTSVNLGEVRVRGIESVIEVRPNGPVSGYVNLAINHGYGRGPITGGFFPTDVADVPGGWFDLDHDQRVSGLASAVYAAHRLYLSATGIYGSGLTNGADIDRSDRDRPVRLQQADPRRSQFHSQCERGLLRQGRRSPGAPRALRRQPARSKVPAQGRVLQRSVRGPAAQHPTPPQRGSLGRNVDSCAGGMGSEWASPLDLLTRRRPTARSSHSPPPARTRRGREMANPAGVDPRGSSSIANGRRL